jgi:uncharacterized protein involved in type VI secretion and phage assembly
VANDPWILGRAATHYGVVEGIVTDIKDPDGYGRVKVKFPWLGGEIVSAWARVATPMAGNNMGWVIYPEVDDEVLIDFVNGNVHEPIVLGSLFNGKDKPPYDNADGKNNIRTLVSRSGHVIEIDDTSGSEKITLKDKSGGLIIVMDTAGKKISITSSGDIAIKADKNFQVDAKEIAMKSGSNTKLEAGSAFEASAGSEAKIQGGGQVNVKGATVNLN